MSLIGTLARFVTAETQPAFAEHGHALLPTLLVHASRHPDPEVRGAYGATAAALEPVLGIQLAVEDPSAEDPESLVPEYSGRMQAITGQLRARCPERLPAMISGVPPRLYPCE